jgi:hypothetical protein
VTSTATPRTECSAADDFYYCSPWRRPSSAPVIDACGSAGGRGGRHPGQGDGGFSADCPPPRAASVGVADGRSSLVIHHPSFVTRQHLRVHHFPGHRRRCDRSLRCSDTNTTHSRVGDLGSRTLAPAPLGVVWAAGGAVEVAWTSAANYLCPARSPEDRGELAAGPPPPFTPPSEPLAPYAWP